MPAHGNRQLFLFHGGFIRDNDNGGRVFLVYSNASVARRHHTRRQLHVLTGASDVAKLPGHGTVRSLVSRTVGRTSGGGIKIICLSLSGFGGIGSTCKRLFNSRLLHSISLTVLDYLRRSRILTHPNNSRFLMLTSGASRDTLRTVTSQVLAHLQLPFHVNLVRICADYSMNVTLSPRRNSSDATVVHRTSATVCATGRNKQKRFYIFAPRVGRQMFRCL